MATALLDRIEAPDDLGAMTGAELDALAADLRAEIVRVTTENGGHLATNLGAVELTLALHRVLHSPTDKIVWDVGNQCYAHKILTGRRDRLDTLRQPGGLSGFVNRLESPHDVMTSGHAGTALSTALGLALARDRRGEDHAVVAVVGDGALTAGMAFEALNHLGSLGMAGRLPGRNVCLGNSRGALLRLFSS